MSSNPNPRIGERTIDWRELHGKPNLTARIRLIDGGFYLYPANGKASARLRIVNSEGRSKPVKAASRFSF